MKHFRKVGEPFWKFGKRVQQYEYAPDAPEPDMFPQEIAVVTYPDGTERILQAGGTWKLLIEDPTGEFD